MISNDTAQLALAELGSADWTMKSQAMSAAAVARDDDQFWSLLAVAIPDVFKVGPKGYIHGWIFVGAPGVGARVFHPQHGMGTVTAHHGTHVDVSFEKSGAKHTFEAKEHTAKGRLMERGAHRSQLTDRVVQNPKSIKDMGHEDLKSVDQELTRRAGALGQKGKVSPTHQKVKDEIARRGASGGAKPEPKTEPKKPSAKKPKDNGAPEDEKIDSAWGKLHPADIAVQHYGGAVFNSKQYNDAIRELDRRGATPEGRDMVSRARRQMAKDLANHEAHEKEYNKPGGRGDMVKAKQEADRLSEEADKKGTSAAHEAAASANRRALTLSYRHDPGASLTHQLYNTRIKLHDMKAADQREREPKSLAQRRKEYQTAASLAPHASTATLALRSAEQHEQGARQHRRAAELATTDAQRAKHEKAAKAFDDAAAAKRKSDADEKAASEQRIREAAERNERDRKAREEYKNSPQNKINQHARRTMIDPGHAAKLKPQEAKDTLDRINRAIDEEKPTGTDLERAQRAKAALEKRVAEGVEAEKPKQEADKVSAKARRTGKREDHVAAAKAQQAAGNQYKTRDHVQTVEAIDDSNESKEDAEAHAAGAATSNDPEAHDAAAKSYHEAADSMEEVPGGKKQAGKLREAAAHHEGMAKNLREKIANYAKAFVHANKLSNAAHKQGSKVAHQAAAAAHRVASEVSVTGAQRRHHIAEVARHVAAADKASK